MIRRTFEALADLAEPTLVETRIPIPPRDAATAPEPSRGRRPPDDESQRPPHPPQPPAPPRAARRPIADALASPVAVRRAFLLMEILGPPVALRDPASGHRIG